MRISEVSALVTGGASGLGLATTELLVKRGATVTVLDLPTSQGSALVGRFHGSVRFAPADVTSEVEVESAVDTALESGPLRILVHCAGRGGDQKRIVDKDHRPGDVDSFREVVDVNLTGTYNVLRMAAAAMSRNTVIDGDRGVCVLTASVAAFDGQVGQVSYAASKAGVHGMTLVAARDLASHQIRVNTIAPGVFDTPMLSRLRDDIRQGLAQTVPHPGRLGQPEDYAQLAVAVIENRYLNGETIRLDGAIRMAPR